MNSPNQPTERVGLGEEETQPLQDWLAAPELPAAEGLPTWLSDLPEPTPTARPAVPAGAPAIRPSPSFTPNGGPSACPPAAKPTAKTIPPAPVSTAKIDLPAIQTPAKPAVRRVATIAPALMPRFRVHIAEPKEFRLGQRSRVELHLTNTGAGVARGVRLLLASSEGWRWTPDTPQDGFLGDLEPGAVREIQVSGEALPGGKWTIEFTVITADGLKGAGRVPLVVLEPDLDLRIQVPAEASVGQAITARIEAANASSVLAKGGRLACILPEGVGFRSASHGGQHETAKRQVIWKLEDLAPGGILGRTVEIDLEIPGELAILAAVRAEHRGEIRAKATCIGRLAPAPPSKLLEDVLAEIDREVEQSLEAQAQAGQAKSDLRPVGTQDRYVVFTLAGSDYAVPLAHVVEIGQARQITAVPHLPDWVLGVANVRGDIVSMINLRSFLHLEHAEPAAGSQVVLVRSLQDELTTGLLVDAVRGIRPLPADRLPIPPPAKARPLDQWVSGLVDHQSRLLMVLDLERLLLSPQMRL